MGVEENPVSEAEVTQNPKTSRLAKAKVIFGNLRQRSERITSSLKRSKIASQAETTPASPVTETFKYFPIESESEEALDPEAERAKIAKVREIAGLESLQIRDAQETEKRQLVDQFLEKKLAKLLQNGEGYIDKIDRLESFKDGREIITRPVSDTAIDKVKKGVATKLLQARHVPNPNQLLTVLKQKHFLSDYNLALHPSVAVNLQRLGAELNPEQISQAFDRLYTVGYRTFYSWSSFISNPEFYNILITFGRLDQQAFKEISNQLNPYFFLTENPPLSLDDESPELRRQIAPGLSEMTSIFAEGGLNKERKHRLDLAQKVALLDHRPLVDSPNPKYPGINRTYWISLDQILDNKFEDQTLQRYVKVAEDMVYQNIKAGHEDPALRDEVFKGFREMEQNGTFVAVERIQASGIAVNRIVHGLTNQYASYHGSYLNTPELKLEELQAADRLAQDPIKLEWFRTFKQLLKKGPIAHFDALKYADLFEQREEITGFLEFYQSLKSISQAPLPALDQVIDFEEYPKNYKSVNYSYQSPRFEVNAKTLRNYLDKAITKENVNYIIFMKVNAFKNEQGYYDPKEITFDKSMLPLLTFLNTRFADIKTYLDQSGPTSQLVSELLRGNIKVGDKQLNGLVRSVSYKSQLEPALVLSNLNRLDSTNTMILLRQPSFRNLDLTLLPPEQSQLLHFVQQLDQIEVGIVEMYKGKITDLCLNGQPSLIFLKALNHKTGDIRQYIPEDYLNNLGLSTSDKQLVTLLIAQEGNTYASGFLLDNIEQFPSLVDSEGQPNLTFFGMVSAKGSNLVDRFTNYLTPALLETASPVQRGFWQHYLESSTSLRSLMIRSKVRIEELLEQSNGSTELIKPYLEVMTKIDESPSQEIQRLKNQLLDQIIKTPNPVAAYSQIESVFVLNNLPQVGKVFRVFDILHPNIQKEPNMYSPVLTKAHHERGAYKQRADIIYRDLLRTHLLSGNRSLYEYLTFLKEGVAVFDQVSQGVPVSERDKQRAVYTLQKLKTLHVNSLLGKQEALEDQPPAIGNLNTEITALKKNLGVSQGQTIRGRIEQMFLKPAGYHSTEEVLQVMSTAKKQASQRSLEYFEQVKGEGQDSHLKLDAGDLIKGVGEQYIENILQNGSVAKEYLGASATSDATPFGTDVTEVTAEDAKAGWTFALTQSAFGVTGGFGQLGLVFKDRGKFQRTTPTEPAKYDPAKYEVYHSGVVDQVRHKDVRTGLPSTEIDFMIATDSLLTNQHEMEKIYYAIAQQGFYIPIANKEGKVIFTPEVYQQYRHTFDGIEAFDGNPLSVHELKPQDPGYVQLQQLIEQVKTNAQVTAQFSDRIRLMIEQTLSDKLIKLQDEFDTSWLGARLYDTGSTGRYTNTPGQYDFDLMLILDSADFSKASQVKDTLIQMLKAGQDNSHTESSGYVQLRAQGATGIVEGQALDIDVGIGKKSTIRPFASNDAITEKLRWIRENLGENEYYQVIGNIILAKQVLKEGHAYKKLEDGGFGGIGTETWILSNGGNIVEAMRSFWQTSHENGATLPFKQFKTRYKILDAGINLKNGYHDNFVYNMTETGYSALLQTASNFLQFSG